MSEPFEGRKIRIGGVVQGVGFRPFIYEIALANKLKGWVKNSTAGVEIEVIGTKGDLEKFISQIKSDPPPLARILSLSSEEITPISHSKFVILKSEEVEGAFQPISPDVSICEDCLQELFDPSDRHYRYPFTNCTKCGPRYTIIKDIPYDRPKTTMANFGMCSECAREYNDPLDRRFHAQPVACPACGPKIWLEGGGDVVNGNEKAIQATRAKIEGGKIIAVKGLGGFHLVCSALDSNVILELRKRKNRIAKPFAVMMPDIETVRKYCFLSEEEEKLLMSIERPIVILEQKPNNSISSQLAPGQSSLGVMLPYTPLHYLLTEKGEGFPDALVMTSGNLSEEPIVSANGEAISRLSSIADYFLMHDREIEAKCDDSVTRIIEISGDKTAYKIRRSRGFAPFPILLNNKVPPMLAVGGELKNAFCLTRDNMAFLSPHIGDLENLETLDVFNKNVEHYENLFKIQPETVVHDLHPGYLSTKYAHDRASKETMQKIGVQHHHAHVASCMAENGLTGDQPVLGVSFDGTGYGLDGAIWGGEFLIADYKSFERVTHLEYIPMPGGEKAIQEPYRLALAWISKYGLDWDDGLEMIKSVSSEEKRILEKQIQHQINSPLTSSMGRLFDAVSALASVCPLAKYEAQAAIELEALVDPSLIDFYSFEIAENVINPEPLFQALYIDLIKGVSKSIISSKFHNGVAEMVKDVCKLQAGKYGIMDVALSGGVWQNKTLLSKTVPLLRKEGFRVIVHQEVPCNDGGIALGQAIISSKITQEA